MNLRSFFDELVKIAAFANALPPPSSSFSMMEGRLNLPSPRMPGNIPSEQEAFATAQRYQDAHNAVKAQRAVAPATASGSALGHAPTLPAASGGPAFAATARPPMPMGGVPTVRPGAVTGSTLRVPGAAGTVRPGGALASLAGRTEQAAAKTVAPGMLRRAAGAIAHV